MNLQDYSLVVYDAVCIDIIGEHKGGLQPGSPNPLLNEKKNIVNTMIPKVLRNSHFSSNQPLKLADDWYTGIMKNNKNLRSYF